MVILALGIITFLPSLTGFAEQPRAIKPNDVTGSSAAVTVGDWPLVHTTQFLPVDDRGDVVADAPGPQVTNVFDRLDDALGAAGSSFERIIKLNMYIARGEIMADVQRELARRFSGPYKPAVSFGITKLPHAGALIAADAVAASSLEPRRGVTHVAQPAATGNSTATSTIVPRGTRIYIAGQAERGDSLAEATRNTLERLHATLRFLGRNLDDVAQLKAFLTPMTDAASVEREIAAFFKPNPVPPLAVVEWQSAATTPIEIELIAWGGLNNTGANVEYVTPPGTNASPVFSRVARLNHSGSIYVSGLLAAAADQRDLQVIDPSNAEREVKEIFASLERILQSAGSDFRHLVKATYYVSNDAASQKLNELRPNYYDPQRPPSASKAMVAGVGAKGHGFTMDMIAVPAWTDDRPEYGPPEFGYGLSDDDSSAGWLSLFDGHSTFGWVGSRLENGALEGGKTTTAFGNCEWRAWFDRGGTMNIAGREHQVPAGEFRLAAEDAGASDVKPIRIGEGVRVRQLAVRPAGLKALFNGRDMSGWRRMDRAAIAEDRRPVWQVEDGSLRARGGPGCVEFVGISTPSQIHGNSLSQETRWGDMILQLDVRTRARHANGGVFFRAIPGDFMNGYEAQVFNRSEDGDPARPAFWCTGGIDDRQNARRMVSRDGQFFKMTVIAQGPRIATWVNGYQQIDWIDERPPHANPRQGLRIEPGAVQLQAHDAATDVEFKSINVLNW